MWFNAIHYYLLYLNLLSQLILDFPLNQTRRHMNKRVSAVKQVLILGKICTQIMFIFSIKPSIHAPSHHLNNVKKVFTNQIRPYLNENNPGLETEASCVHTFNEIAFYLYDIHCFQVFEVITWCVYGGL